jgi:hypothetical protein
MWVLQIPVHQSPIYKQSNKAKHKQYQNVFWQIIRLSYFFDIWPRKPELKYILRSIMHQSLGMTYVLCPTALTTFFEIGVY